MHGVAEEMDQEMHEPKDETPHPSRGLDDNDHCKSREGDDEDGHVSQERHEDADDANDGRGMRHQ